MKKAFYAFQALILLVLLVKIAVFWGLIKPFEVSRGFLSENRALAESSHSGSQVVIRDVLEDELVKPRNLLSALQERQKELDDRESSIHAEEVKLLSLKKEITDKIDILLNLEKKLNTVIGADREAQEKRYKGLAKVYEATPPAKAGAMLEKLDLKTAAGITMHMKREKAGAIWGFLSPQKAVEITKEITSATQNVP